MTFIKLFNVSISALVWQKPRNIISPPFHFNVLEQFFHVFNHCSNTFISILETKSVKGPINIWPLLQSYSLDVICGNKKFNNKFSQIEHFHFYRNINGKTNKCSI